MRTEGKTFVVSNHLPLPHESENTTPHFLRPSSPGLVRTLDTVMWDSGGTWIGCSPTGDIVALAEAGEDRSERHGYSIAPVCLRPDLKMDHERFANDTIWPLYGRTHSTRTSRRPMLLRGFGACPRKA